MENKKEMKMEVRKELLIGIILISIISLIFLASALTSELEIELSNLVSELESGDYGWLVDYNVDYPSVEVYEENSSLKIADFGIINEDKKYQVYLDGSSGAGLGNKTQNIFDLKILGGSVEFDYIVDPIILGNSNAVRTNTTYENNFTHLNVSNSSIVAYYPFDDNVSATTVYDYTNGSNDGTVVGGAVYNVSGWVGGAYTFDAVNDVINVTYPFGGLNTATTGTWSAWVNTAEGSVFLSFGKSDINHQIMMQSITLNVLRGLAVSSAGVVQWDLRTTSGIGQNNTWVHVAMTHNGTEPILYVNGVAVAQSFSTSTDKTIWLNDFPTLNKMTIGANAITPQAFFKGSVDEVMIWNIALTSTEVLAIYNNQTSRFYGTGEMNFTGVNFAGNDTINITLAGCQQNLGTSLRAKVNDGAYVNFSSGCTIQDYNATGNLNSANVTIGFVSDANKFYTPLVIGNITLDSRDLIAPNLTINIPTNNSFSSQTNLSINYTAQSNDLSACWYSNDTYTANTTLANCNTNITTVKWAEGQHNVTIWVNDTANSVNSSMVTFTIDTILPTFAWENPTPTDKSGTTSTSVYLNATVTDATQTSAWFDWNKSLVGYWPMDFRNSTGVYDNSSNENFGTAVGGAVFNSSGFYGGAYTFDGVNDYININPVLTNNLATTTKGTWSIWVKPNEASPSGSQSIISFGKSDTADIITMHYLGTTGIFRFVGTAGGVTKWDLRTTTTPFTSNAWTHLAIVQNGTSPVLYVNGVAVAQSFITSTDKSSWFSNVVLDTGRIGDWSYNSAGEALFFNGSVDEVMIFNRALSSTEILSLYNNTANRLQNNFTSLSQATYNYSAYSIDKAGNLNITSPDRQITVDTTFPTISYDPETPADNSTINSNSIYVNVSVADSNFENMSYSLYNESLNISGLVGYWNFDRNTTTIRDLSKQGNDGTRSGGVNWTTGGKLGNAYSLDGVNDAVNLSNNILTNNLATTTKGTWSAWIKPVDATPTASSYIIQFGDTDANERIIMFATTTGLLDAFLVDAGVNQWGLDTDAVAFSDNTWTHVALVQDGTSPVIYVNGVAIAQAFYITTDKTKWFSATTGIDNGRIGNGVYNNLNTGYFTGNIDEPMIFNRALSSTEISELYNRQLVNYTTYSSITPSINWTSLSENDYHYFTDVIDKAENYNFTQIRWVELDTTFPTLSFANPTTNTSNLSQDFILANVSFTETNINITNITLYNSTQNIINSTTGTTSPVYINFSGLSDGTYYLNATISDTAGNKNQTETRTIILDMINPSLNITFPNNNSFSSVTNLSINYTRSDALSGLSTCWYSNDTYTANTTLANCGNITTVQWAEGQHNVTIWVNDTANSVNSSMVTFTIDTTFPTISYESQTPVDNSTIASNSIYVNVSLTETNFENISYSLYNESLNTSDLVGYWNFDKNTTLVNDLSGKNNDGTRNGGVNWTTGGKLGSGYSFDGVDDYISINSVLTNNLATTTTGTWSAWVKPVDATPTTSMEIVGFTQEAVLGDRIEFYINSTGHLQAEATFSGPKYWALSTDASAVSDNTWTHLAIVQNGTSPVFYVNGIVPAQSFTVTANKTYWFNNLVLNRGRIGDRINGNPIAEGLFFNGTIDEVMIFNKSLSAADISELYNRGLVNHTTYSTQTTSINWTGLADNDYNYFADILDKTDNYNSTVIRLLKLDTTFPTLSFANPTTNTSNLSQNFIQANVSVTEINLNTINISLFNSTQNIINSTTGTTSPVYINFSGLSDGRYYLNATVNDTAGNKNYTGTRIIGLDRVAPNLTINSPTATTYTISTILFNATSIDATTLVDSCWYTTNSGATNRTLSKDGTTNFYNFTASGFADAGYTARFYCNDTANNINNTQNVTFTVNTFVPAGGGPAPAVAGGGGGVPSKPEKKRIFNLEYNMYDQTISLKQVEFDKLGITNNGEVADEYNIEVKTIENIISFEDKKIKLEPEESKEIEFKISSPKEPGIYTGKIIVSNGVSEREVLVTINVKTEKSLFDITLTIPESLKTLLIGQNLISKIDLIQMGLKENIDITLNYVIKDFEGQTYLSESETIAVFDQKSYEKEFFTSELSPGQYILGTELIHPDGVAVASTHFVVQEKGIKFGKEEILLISLILVLIVISLVIFLSIRKYKKVGRALRKKQE